MLLFFFLMHEVQSGEALAFDTYIAELFFRRRENFFVHFLQVHYLSWEIQVHWFWKLIMCSIFVDNKEGLLGPWPSSLSELLGVMC